MRVFVRRMSHLRFFRAILSRNFIARQSRSMQLRHCGINNNWPISLLSDCLCDKDAGCDITVACSNFVARSSCATKSQAWHRSYAIEVLRLTCTDVSHFTVSFQWYPSPWGPVIFGCPELTVVTPVPGECDGRRSVSSGGDAEWKRLLRKEWGGDKEVCVKWCNVISD